jgi:hypothetical protein
MRILHQKIQAMRLREAVVAEDIEVFLRLAE